MLSYEVQYEKGRILNVRSIVTKGTLDAGVAVREGKGARGNGARGIQLRVLPAILSHTAKSGRAQTCTRRGQYMSMEIG